MDESARRRRDRRRAEHLRPSRAQLHHGLRRPLKRTWLFLAATALGGVAIAIQSRINGELAARLHEPLGAAFANVETAALVAFWITVTRRVGIVDRLRRPGAQWWFWTGGVLGATFVYGVARTAPHIGVAAASIAVAAGTTSAALVVDGLGISASGRHAPSLARFAGASIAISAVLVSRAGSAHLSGHATDYAIAFIAGVAIGIQHPVNSRLATVLGDRSLAATVSMVTGGVAMLAIAALALRVTDWPTTPWLYLGGSIGATYVFAAVPLVTRLGALRFSLATLTGQLLGAAMLDAVAPINGNDLTTGALIGVAMAVVAVGVTSLDRPERAATPPA